MTTHSTSEAIRKALERMAVGAAWNKLNTSKEITDPEQYRLGFVAGAELGIKIGELTESIVRLKHFINLDSTLEWAEDSLTEAEAELARLLEKQ